MKDKITHHKYGQRGSFDLRRTQARHGINSEFTSDVNLEETNLKLTVVK